MVIPSVQGKQREEQSLVLLGEDFSFRKWNLRVWWAPGIHGELPSEQGHTWNWEGRQGLKNRFQKSLREKKVCLSFEPAILLVGISPKNIIKDMCEDLSTKMLIV